MNLGAEIAVISNEETMCQNSVLLQGRLQTPVDDFQSLSVARLQREVGTNDLF